MIGLRLEICSGLDQHITSYVYISYNLSRLDVIISRCHMLLQRIHQLPPPCVIVIVSDCAVCSDEYGTGVSNSCHRCDNTKAHLLIAIGAVFCLVLLLLLFFAVVFLVGGLDAIDVVRQSVGRTFSVGSKASSTGPSIAGVRSSEHSRTLGAVGSPVRSFALEATHGDSGAGGGGEVNFGRSRVFPMPQPDSADTEWTFTPALGTDLGVEAGVELSGEKDINSVPSWKAGTSAGHQSGLSAASGYGAGGANAKTIVAADAGGGGVSMGRRLGDKVKRCMSRLPLNKLKILVVVWQILAVFSSITGVEFPASYSRFLSWISVVNLDIGSIFAACCVLPSVNFYTSLLVMTLAPLILSSGLVVTYQMAKHRAGIGSPGVIARRAAWSRHLAAGLLLTFLVSSETRRL